MKRVILWCLMSFPMAVFAAMDGSSIFNNSSYVVLGNPVGLVTVVDFSDYECSHCRSINRTLNYLAKHDPEVRIITVDYPMLSDRSVFAAKAAIASKYQGNYLQFHQALMTAPLPLNEQQVLSLASQVGLNQSQLYQDMEKARVLNDLLANFILGNHFRVKALPTFIVGYTRSPHNTTVFSGSDGQKLLNTVKAYENRLHGA